MNRIVLKNARVLLEDFNFHITDLVLEEGRIVSIGKTEEAGEDLTGKLILPGLIDIHTHGCAGGDHLDGTEEKTAAICSHMAKRGTTGLLATIMTQAQDTMIQAAENVARYAAKGEGARLLGIYLEGPFFSYQYRGAQHPDYLCPPEHGLIDRIQQASGNMVKILSLAPELPGAEAFIRQRKDLRVFLGHTASDYDTAKTAYQAGAVGLTHTFNGMTPLHHRKPGILAAAMENENIFCECICDGFHVHPAMVALLYRQVGPERFCMISDSLRPAGLPDGKYISGGQEVIVEQGNVYLADGTIAGSTTCLLQEVKNLVDWGICSLEKAVYAASAVPARAAGVFDWIGSIREGKCADLLILNAGLDLERVLIGGKEV